MVQVLYSLDVGVGGDTHITPTMYVPTALLV